MPKSAHSRESSRLPRHAQLSQSHGLTKDHSSSRYDDTWGGDGALEEALGRTVTEERTGGWKKV